MSEVTDLAVQEVIKQLHRARIDGAQLRREQKQLETRIAELIKEAGLDIELEGVKDNIKLRSKVEEALYEELKARLLYCHAENGEPRMPGILAPTGQVKMFTVLVYDRAKALTYAIRHKLEGLLSLNVKAFEDMAKTGHLPKSLVAVSKDPRAEVASDLGPVIMAIALEAEAEAVEAE